MKVKTARFIKSCRKVADLPSDGRPQIAFCGRSNCGKSTLLNELTGKAGLARVSRTPGRTQGINLFLINDAFYFVDLPGFGYASAPAKVQEALGAMITAYIREAPDLAGLVFLLDIRHKPSQDDRAMQGLVLENELPTVYLATKADKIGTTKRARHIKLIRETLELDKEAPVMAISSLKGLNIKEALRRVQEAFLPDEQADVRVVLE